MKVCITLILLIMSTHSASADYGYKPKSYGYESENNVGFESGSGTKYQYDLNKPVDSIRYHNDIDAQQRDKINSLKPYSGRDVIEDAYGQTGRGGGIYRK